MWRTIIDTLPHGYTLQEADWQRRHRLLLWVLAAHLPGIALFAALLGQPPLTIASVLVVPTSCLVAGHLLRGHRRTASVLVTLGLVWSSGALVGFSGGAIEAHFHFFIIIGFIALYQDWAPFLFNIAFVVISHGIGSVWQQTLIFSHPAGQGNPWLWSLIHGIAVLFACIGMMLFWRFTEESQQEKDSLVRRLAENEIGRRQFTSDLLVNLARRNQSLLYRQLDIINQLEESEQDPDVLAELFTLDHLATRVRRNAENLIVLSGEQPPRTWSGPVPLRDVLRASIAETEDLERVVFLVDERPAVVGHSVTDLTHLIAELTENAVRFSPPDTVVTIRARPDRTDPGGQLLTVEDWGVGMPDDELAAANALLAEPPEVDLSVSQRLGFHVIARLAARHGIRVTLTATPGSGITAIVALPAELFAGDARPGTTAEPDAPVVPAVEGGSDGNRVREPAGAPSRGGPPDRRPTPTPRMHREQSAGEPVRTPFGSAGPWTGWWQPDHDRGATAPSPAAPSPAAPSRAASSLAGPSPTPRTPAVPAPRGPAPAPAPGPGGLRRRVPLTHLAPELREAPREPERGGDATDAADAAAALSRYQASRRAAVTDHERLS
jgi:signal transduction histidine kinase